MAAHVQLVPEDDGVATAVRNHVHLDLVALLALNESARGAKVERERGHRLRERPEHAPIEDVVHVHLPQLWRPHHPFDGLHVHRQARVGEDLDAHGPNSRSGG